MLSFKEVITVSLILFSVIDILGVIPVIIDLRKRAGKIQSAKATIVAGIIMILFLFLGETILQLFGIDRASFAVAGSIIVFILGIEMVLGATFFKSDPENEAASSIVPLAFPLIAGAGTMTTLISLRAEFYLVNLLVGIFINLIFVYIVLKTSGWLERILGKSGINILRKVFGIILIATAVKLFKINLLIS